MSNDTDGAYVTSYWNGKLEPKLPSTGVFAHTNAPNEPPIANAGPDFEIVLALATNGLDGRASFDPDGQTLTYRWTQTSGPTAVTIMNPASATSGFVAPLEGTYTFALVVNDGKRDSVPDVVSVTRTGYPIPVANAGADSTAGVDGSVTLDGSGSTAYLSAALTYAWTQTVGPMAVTLIGGATNVSPRFVPRQVGTYTFHLIVNDGEHSSAPSYVTITVVAAASVKTSSAVVNGVTSGTVSCPKAVKDTCQVTISLAVDPTARAKGSPVAQTNARLKSGARAKVKLKWSAGGLKLLKAKKSLPMLLTVVTRAPGAPKRTVVSRFIARGR
jgi:hypothetical protein